MKSSKTVFILMACFVFLLGGCSVIPDKPFRHKDYLDLVEGQNLYVIEYDDKGDAHLPSQSARLFDDMRRGITQKDVLLFVHGWHHNARKNDASYLEFKEFLSKLNAGEKKYTGVYVGWRGAPNLLLGLENDLLGLGDILGPMDFTTFEDRKKASVKLGKNGLYDLMDTLNTSISSEHIHRVVAIGHDLGGTAVFHASKGRLENWNRNLFVLLNPAITDDEYGAVSEIRQTSGALPRLITLRTKGALAKNFLLKDIMGNPPAITHDLDACATNEKYCRAYLRALKGSGAVMDECITVLNGDLWKITARDNNGPGRKTCSDANGFASWVVSTGPDATDARSRILTNEQASGLKEILEATHSGNNARDR